MQYQIDQEARIPFLPGNSFSDIQKKDFKKVHTLDYKNGYSIKKTPTLATGLEPIQLYPEYTTDELIQMVGSSSSLTYGTKQYHTAPIAPRFVPAHVAYDKVLLRFDAYFKETIHESIEQYHLRKVKIYYFLEDDSISVVEPPVENSGIPQKVFIKRQRLPKPLSEDGQEYLPGTKQEYYTLKDFNVGVNLRFYSRTFRVVGCDKFTHQYMTQTEKIHLNPPEPIPTDPYIEFRNRARRDYTVPSICPLIRHNDKLKRFLENDRKVLRFFCVWDDRVNMFGELREFVLHYYLVDDSIEIRESPKPNSGRDAFPILLKKQTLPKDDGECYTWKDLYVGAVIQVLGRPFLLRDCDDWTRTYYTQNHPNPPPMTPVPFPTETPTQTHVQTTPPYNGYGSIDDSLGSCKYLVLKPPKKDFVKLLENDHKVLRFVARMESKHKEDSSRRFVISYQLSDDHITIYEPPQKNSGTLGGKFLERSLPLKPVSLTPYSFVHPIGLSTPPEYYTAKDFYVSATLQINHHKFVILDADEYVFEYMEQRPDEFPLSDYREVRKGIKGDFDVVEKELEGSAVEGLVDRKRVVEVLGRVCGVNEHGGITVCRRFEDKYRRVDYKKMLASFLV